APQARRGVDTAISVRAVGRGARCDGAARRPLLVLRRIVVVAPVGGPRGGGAAVLHRVVPGNAAVDWAVAVETGAAQLWTRLARVSAGRAGRVQRPHRRHEAFPSGRATAPDGSGAPRTVCGAAGGQAGADRLSRDGPGLRPTTGSASVHHDQSRAARIVGRTA